MYAWSYILGRDFDSLELLRRIGQKERIHALRGAVEAICMALVRAAEQNSRLRTGYPRDLDKAS